MASNSTTAAAANSYKQRKEDFVSNLTGGDVSEINYVIAVGPAAVMLWSILQSRQSFFKPYTTLGFLVDFLLNISAPLLAVTLYADTPLLLIGLLLVPAIAVYALPPRPPSLRRKQIRPPNPRVQESAGALGPLSTKPFLTTYRACMMILTCLCILAVDFRLFPRRFAKVETWGTSLMDIGVGSFVFSAGLVAVRPMLKARAEGKKDSSLRTRLIHSMRHSLPLLVLGFIRLASVKGLDYAEHVSEYGVHWNFFFTLGFLPPFVAIFQSALRFIPSYAGLALLLSVGYQVALDSTSLKAYILTAPRTDLLSANREGICSFVGYLAIFLAGQDMGMLVLPRSTTTTTTTTRKGSSSSSSPTPTSSGTERNTLLRKMAIRCAIWSLLYFLTTSYGYGAAVSVSRRLANLPYVLWIAAFNSGQLLLVCVVDTVFFPSFYNAADARSEREAYVASTSTVLRAYNRNGLALFLVANLLTGLVNMTVPTLDVGPIATMGVLLAYMGVLTTLAVAWESWGVSIKL